MEVIIPLHAKLWKHIKKHLLLVSAPVLFSPNNKGTHISEKAAVISGFPYLQVQLLYCRSSNCTGSRGALLQPQPVLCTDTGVPHYTQQALSCQVLNGRVVIWFLSDATCLIKEPSIASHQQWFVSDCELWVVVGFYNYKVQLDFFSLALAKDHAGHLDAACVCLLIPFFFFFLEDSSDKGAAECPRRALILAKMHCFWFACAEAAYVVRVLARASSSLGSFIQSCLPLVCRSRAVHCETF